MSKKIFFLIILIIFKIIISIPSCTPDVNFCSICNPVTKLCVKCVKDVYKIDENGGCTYARKCSFGENYCNECNEETNLCKKCENDYFPDENGGCSYTDNCIISDRGICLECKEDFILIGIDDYFTNGVRICKWKYSEDLKNCDRINTANGSCFFCKEGFYLNSGDRKCTKIENCYESSFGICQKCKEGFYLNKKEQKCIKQTDFFKNCKESLDGEKCSICENDFYLSEEGICSSINYCSKSNQYGKCKKCIEGYFLTNYENACTQEENCFSGDKDFGICYSCNENYYLDLKDRKCKSNIENNKYKFCEKVDINGNCLNCIYEYKLGLDNKCTNTNYCEQSENQICVKCIDKYHLGFDNLCTDVEQCIYSNHLTSQCIECENNFYYDKNNKTCKISKDNFINCKSSYNEEYCNECKNDYYLNQTDKICYNNNLKNNFYKCALTTSSGEECMTCIENYYLGKIDKKCSTIEGCQISENENICKQCDDYYYCLDLKTGKCEYNDEIISEEKKFYYRCLITNDEGNACQKCLYDFPLNNKGLCVDDEICEEEKNGICQKCIDDDIFFYCLNKDFGCIETLDSEGCLECNNNNDFEVCTKCKEGYELDKNGKCFEIDN